MDKDWKVQIQTETTTHTHTHTHTNQCFGIRATEERRDNMVKGLISSEYKMATMDIRSAFQ